MQHPLKFVYSRVVSQYLKLKDRFVRKVKAGTFQAQRPGRKSLETGRLKRLERRILSLEAKLGITAGVALIFFAQKSSAQSLGPFTENEPENPLPAPYEIFRPRPVSVDIDGDGDLDFALGSDGYVAFFINKSEPGMPVGHVTENLPFRVYVYGSDISPAFIDFDNDGDFDMLVGRYDGGTAFYENTGGKFEPSFTLLTGASNPFEGIESEYTYSTPTFVDWDGDGDLDLVLGGRFSYTETIKYYENDNGVFTPKIGIENPFEFFNTGSYNDFDRAILTFGDLDGDLDLDVVVGTASDGGVHFLLNNNGDLTPLSVPAFEYTTFKAPLLFDVDADGDLDLLLGNHDSEGFGVSLFENDGTNSFPPRSGFFINPFDGVDFSSRASVSFFDTDGDGDLDAVLGNKYGCCQGSPPSVIYENVNGKFIPQEALSSENNNQYGATPLYYDFDDDGDLDAFFSLEDGYLYFEQTEGGNFELQTITLEPWGGIAFIDFNQDGIRDIVAHDGSVYYLRFYQGNEEPLNFEQIIQPEPFDTREFHSVPIPRIVDINHDGIDDIVVVDREVMAGEIYLHTHFFIGNNEDGLYTYTELPDSPFDGLNIETRGTFDFVDIDGDGDLDALFGVGSDRYYTGQYSYAITDRNGKFRYFENTNPAPEIELEVSTIPYTYNTGPIVLDVDLTLSDSDGDQIREIRVAIVDYQPGDETLSFTPAGSITGNFDSLTGVLTITGTGTQTEFEAVLRTVTYEYLGGAPAAGGRKGFSAGRTTVLTKTITFVAIDEELTAPLAASMAIDVTFPNIAPVVTAGAGNPSFVANGSPVTIDPGLIIQDGDDADLEQATIQISSSSFIVGEDELLFTGAAGISGNYDPATGVLTLTGTGTLADYQNIIRNVQYNNISATPTLQNRTIEFSVNDGEDESNLVSKVVQLVAEPLNSPPIVTTSTESVQFIAPGPAVAIDPTLTVTDTDDTDLTGASVAISGGTFVAGQDQLEFTDHNGISGSFDALTGVLTLTGASSVTNYQTALRSVRYNNLSSMPNTQDRTFTFSVTDGTDTSLPATKIVTVVISNDPPVITPEVLTTTIQGSASIDLTNLISDPNGNLDPTSFAVTVQPLSGAVATIDADNTLRIDYDGVTFAGTDRLTIQACDDLGSCTSAEITIEVVGSVVAYNAISLNGDDKNDRLILQHIEALYPVNHVYIFTRWGDVVFDITNYNNQTRVFRGYNNNGNELASGTYYYRIEAPELSKPITGYLTIKR